MMGVPSSYALMLTVSLLLCGFSGSRFELEKFLAQLWLRALPPVGPEPKYHIWLRGRVSLLCQAGQGWHQQPPVHPCWLSSKGYNPLLQMTSNNAVQCSPGGILLALRSPCSTAGGKGLSLLPPPLPSAPDRCARGIQESPSRAWLLSEGPSTSHSLLRSEGGRLTFSLRSPQPATPCPQHLIFWEENGGVE